MSQGRVLIIAGSDSGGGAGIQADIKAVTALGGFAMTAVTAITVQNTRGVFGVHPVPLAVIADQIRVCADDLGVDCVKTGMLGTVDTVEAVAAALDAHAGNAPVVVDPVMVAKGGAALLEERAIAAVRALMIPRAALITPNAPEAERLTGVAIHTHQDQQRAAEALLKLGARAALIKGGHVPGERIMDVLMTADAAPIVLEHPRIATRATHGTGCTLASAIAVSLAQGLPLEPALRRAARYLHEAMLRAPGFGAGHAPLHHGWTVRSDV